MDTASRQPDSEPDAREEILAQFVEDLEEHGSQAIEDYGQRYPELAARIHDLVTTRKAVQQTRPEPDPPIPERLGEFRILREIGHGGMGRIFEAIQDRLNRRVALKVILHGRILPEARDRFLREQEVLAQLHQTNIVSIHTAGEEGALQYFAMPYIAGASLSHVVQTVLQGGSTQPGSKTPSLARLAGIMAEDGKRAARGQSSSPPPTTESAEVRRPDPDLTKRNGRAAALAGRISLSPEYFRSVGEAMVQVADALHHAHTVRHEHGAGFLHRDLKPSNLMIEKSGRCWLIDFGLAGYLHGNDGAAAPGELAVNHGTGACSGIVGTPSYMAPEQFEGKADVRSDVWGLGVTLYELLALRPAFAGKGYDETRTRVVSKEPTAPRALVSNVPADLAAICRKAMQHGPGDRYQTAGEFAADLRRWLCREPTTARPARVFRRAWMWSRRNKGWAAAIGVAMLFSMVLAVGALLLEKNIAEGALAEASHAKDRAAASELREQEGERQRRHELQVQEVQGLRLKVRHEGWSARTLQLAKEAAELSKDDNLRDQAAAALLGLDARAEKFITKWGASSITFDASGKKLLLGGLAPEKLRSYGGESAKLWDPEQDQILHASDHKAPGPVAFNASGTPLQLVVSPDDRLKLLLWDVARNRRVREFTITVDEPAPANRVILTMTADAAFLAAAVTLSDQKETVAVWDAGKSEPILNFSGSVSALALSPDHSFIATGDEAGQITVRSLANGETLATWLSDQSAISSLAFQPDRRRRELNQHPLGGWLLAAGDASGTIAIWDVETRVSRAVCRGSNFHVHALAFSPNGMTLASAGRKEVKLWDIATGRLILNLGCTNWLTGVAFSPDGRRLAACAGSEFDSYMVTVWELETSRGIKTLRGLAGGVSKVVLSQDERLLAALGQDNRVGVWNLHTDQLLHVFEAPKVAWVDNAALAFSPDNRQLAFAGSSTTFGRAKLWDIVTGKELRSWTFSPGLNNRLAFASSRKLLLFQVETRDGKHLLGSSVDRRENPVVGRVRNLLCDTPQKPLCEISEFNWRIDYPQISKNGRIIVLVGYSGKDRAEKRQIKAFDGETGKPLWSSLTEYCKPKDERLSLTLDSSGRFLTICLREPDVASPSQPTLVELPSGKYLGLTDPWAASGTGLSPDMPYWVDLNREKHVGHLCFVPRGKRAPVVILGLDVEVDGVEIQFNAAGTHFAWGNVDGTVNVCDLPEVQRQLARLGLGW